MKDSTKHFLLTIEQELMCVKLYLVGRSSPLEPKKEGSHPLPLSKP
jgi:hypothetical protein